MSHHNAHHHVRPPEPTVILAAEGRHRAVSSEIIAKRAYEKFEARGRSHGHDREDWIAAERELNHEAGGED
jgi:hypothetical protein